MRFCSLFTFISLALTAAAEQPKSDRVPCDSASRIEVTVSRIDAGEAERSLGCAVARCEIHNGSDRDGTWKLALTLGDASKTHESRDIPVAAGASVILDLPVNNNIDGSNLAWSLRGPGISSGGQQGNLYSGSSRYGFVYGSSSVISVLASGDTSISFRSKKSLTSASSSSSSSNDVCLELEPRSWPSDWRALCGFRKAVLTSSEWLSLPSDRQQALRDWVFAGGHLGFLPPHDPKIQQEFIPGNGRGLGRISFLAAGSLPDDAPSPQADRVNEFITNTLTKQQNILAVPAASLFFPCLILTLFAIAVGPLNLLVWAKDGRRHLLFITTPVISLIASVLLGLYILLMDGVGGSGRSSAIAYLDSQQQRMLVRQVNTSVTGLMPSRSGTMPSSSLFKQIPETSGRGDFSLEFHSDGQQVFGDHLRSRSRQSQSLTRLSSSRASLDLLADGSYRNSLPVAIKGGLVYHKGALMSCAPSLPGSKLDLHPIDKEEAENLMESGLGMNEVAKQAMPPIPGSNGIPLPASEGGFALICDNGELAPQVFTQIKWKTAPMLLIGEAQEVRQ